MTEEERRRREAALKFYNAKVLLDRTPTTEYKPKYTSPEQAKQFNSPTTVVKPKQSFFNKFRDLFDANTQADQYRRSIKNEALNYAQQQKDKGITRISNNAGQRLVNTGKSLYEGAVEAPAFIGKGLSVGSSTQQRANETELRLQQQTTSSVLKAQQKIKDPNVSYEEKLRWANYLTKSAPQFAQQEVGARQGFEQQVSDTDQVKAAAALASMGIDIATLGVGTAGAIGAKTAAKQGTKQLIKFLAKEGAITGLTAAPSGALSPVIQKGTDASAGEIAQGAATAFAFGAAIPVAGYGLGKVTSKITNKLRGEAGYISGLSDEVVIKERLAKILPEVADDELLQISKILAEETDKKVISTILEEVAKPSAAAEVATKLVDDLASTKSPAKITKYIDDALPNLPPAEKNALTEFIKKSNSGEEIAKAIEQAKIRETEVAKLVTDATPQTPVTKEAELLQEATTTPQGAEINTPPVKETVTSTSKDIAQGDYTNLADQIATQAEESKNLYKGKSNVQKAKEIWEPRSAAIDIDRKFATSQGKKLREISKADSIEALIERSEQSKQIAAEYLKDSNIAKTIQKYGRGGSGEVEFNTYRLFMRDLEQQADGRPAMFRGVSVDDMQKWIADYEASNPSARQDLISLSKDLQAVQDLSVTSDAAFMSKAELDAARAKRDGTQYQYWTPAQRALPEETVAPIINAQNVGTLGKQRVLQEFTGSDIPLDPSFDALTDYAETVFKQLGQSRVVQKVSERVQQGVIPGARFIQTGDEAARIKVVQKTIKDLRDTLGSLKKEKSKLKFRTSAANKELKASSREVSNRVREQLRSIVDDADAATAISTMSDQDLQSVMEMLVTPDMKKVPNVQRIHDKFVKKSEAHALLAQKLDDIKMDIQSVENAKKGLGRELVDLRPDSTTGRQTILGIDANGNKFKIEIPPEYAAVLKGTDKEQLNAALKVSRTIQQPFREAFTGILNPSFQLAQATYNAMMAPIISDAGIKVYSPKAVKAAIESFTNHGEFQKLLNENGAIHYGGNLSKLASDSTADALASQADALSRAKWFANPKRAWEKLSQLGGKLDQAARTASAKGVEQQSLKSGRSAAEATADAVYAYNNTLPNFSNVSSLVKGIDSMVMYTGAGQAGTRTILRAIRENPLRVGGRMGAVGLGLTGVAAYNMATDAGQEFYADMRNSGKDYILDNNIVIVLPGATKNKQTGEWTGIVKVPIAPELRPMNKAVQETIDKNNSGVPLKVYAMTLFDFVTGQARTSSNPAVQTAYGVTTGKDPRTGRDIYDESSTPEEKKSEIAGYITRQFGVPGQVASGNPGAVVDSITSKYYGAKGLSSGGQFYKVEADAIKQQQLNENELKLYLSAVAPRSKNLAGNDIKDRTYYDSALRAVAWQQSPKTFEVSRAIDAAQRADGKTGDPIFDLDPKQRQIILNMMANYSPGNKEDSTVYDLNPWIKDFNEKRSAFYDEIRVNRTKDLESLKSIKNPDKSTKEKITNLEESLSSYGIDPKGLKIPTASPEVSAKMKQLEGVTDKAARAQFYQDNPEITQFFQEQNDYQRAKREFLGLPQFDKYPEPTKEVQSYLDEYNKLPSKNGPAKKDGTPSSPDRSAWIKANPAKWAEITKQWTMQDFYRLQEEGSLAVYEGIDFTEDGIKSIQDISKYLDSQGGSGAKFGYGSGSGSPDKGISQLFKNINFTQEAPKVRLAASKPQLKKVKLYSGKKPKVKIRL